MSVGILPIRWFAWGLMAGAASGCAGSAGTPLSVATMPPAPEIVVPVEPPAAAGFTVLEAEALVSVAVMRLADGDWRGYAELLHPDDLTSFARVFRLMADQDKSGETAWVFFGGLNYGARRKLSDADVFVRVMRSIMRLDPDLDFALSSMQVEIVGTVADGEEFLVVERVRFDLLGSEMRCIDVTVVKPFGAELRVGMDADLDQMARSMELAMES